MSVSLADLVDASSAIAATRLRLAKRGILSGVLEKATPEEIPLVVAYLSGRPRQDTLGIGWSALGSQSPPPAATATLSLTDVDDILEELATTSGAGSVARRANLLDRLLAAATETEQDFLQRLLLRDLRQGATEGLMIEGIAAASGLPAADIRRAAMMSGSLIEAGVVALTEGAAAIAAVRLRVLIPIQPMLASTADDLGSAVASFGRASVEAKLDGARVQVHKLGDTVLVVTRNLKDVSRRVPEVVEAVAALPFTSLILDGEVLALDDDGRPYPFQETMSRFGSKLDVGEARRALPLQPFFFDVLHADGKDILDLPLQERQEVLDRLPAALRVPRAIIDEIDEAERYLAATLAAGHEGVMVKDLGAPYAAGRRGSAWLKVKPVHNLDLVVLAVEWGSGRRKGWLSNLHLGARDRTGGFVMLGKTFKGLTDEMLAWQTERFLELETHRTGHVVHVRPEQVVEIALDGVQASTRYPGGMALRFARVKGYRGDKTADEADTIDAVRALFDGAR
jgi:DNA ligase-1